MLVIRFRGPEGHRLPVPALDAARLVHVAAEHDRRARRKDGPRDAAHLHARSSWRMAERRKKALAPSKASGRRRRRTTMALVSVRQLLDHAAENGYGVPAFNVNDMEQIQAIMEAADEVGQPGHPAGLGRRAEVRGRGVPAQARARRRSRRGRTSPWRCTRTTARARRSASSSIRSGFTSVMMDGSLLADAQDAGELRLQRRGHARWSSRWRTRSA